MTRSVNYNGFRIVLVIGFLAFFTYEVLSPEATLVAECKGTGGWVNLFGSTGVNVGDDGMICLSDFQAGVILIEAYDSTLIPTWENDAVDHPQLIIAPNPFRTGARLMISTNNKLEDVDILIYTLDGKILHSTHLAEIIP